MNLLTLIRLMAGGEGSGPNAPCPQCGPTPKAFAPGSGSGKYAHYGKATSKMVLGIWRNGSTYAYLYQKMMTGDWIKINDVVNDAHAQNLDRLKDPLKAKDRIVELHKVGKKLGNAWQIEWNEDRSSARLVMQKATDVAKGVEGITDKMQHAALVAVQKLLSGNGLNPSISKQVLQEFFKDAGISNDKLITSSVNSWTGSPHGATAQFLRRVAADYYGRNWSDEYIDGHNNAKDTTTFKYNELKEQALAVKALSTEYIRASGIGYMYRGIHGPAAAKIRQAVDAGLPVEVPVNALTGFSVSQKSASKFGTGSGGIMIRVKINPEDVWVASGALGHMFGSFLKSEKEYLVGCKQPKLILNPDDVMTNNHKPSWSKISAAALGGSVKLDSAIKMQEPAGVYQHSDGNSDKFFGVRKSKVSAGGPGSGRRPGSGKKWKNLSDEEKHNVARTDPRQTSIFGPGHAKEIAEYKPPKGPAQTALGVNRDYKSWGNKVQYNLDWHNNRMQELMQQGMSKSAASTQALKDMQEAAKGKKVSAWSAAPSAGMRKSISRGFGKIKHPAGHKPAGHGIGMGKGAFKPTPSLHRPMLDAGGPGSGCHGSNCGRHSVSVSKDKDEYSGREVHKFNVGDHVVATHKKWYGYSNNKFGAAKVLMRDTKWDADALRKLGYNPDKMPFADKFFSQKSAPTKAEIEERLARMPWTAPDVKALGEPDVPSSSHGYMEPIPTYHPPSARNARRLSVDNPGETDNTYGDVSKRKEAFEYRMKLLKRSAPGGLPALIPVGTTGVEHHMGSAYFPGVYGKGKVRIKQRPAKIMGAKVTHISYKK